MKSCRFFKMCKMIKCDRFKLALPAYNLPTSIILIVVASLCFCKSYNGNFVFDDSEAIVNNKDVQETPLYQVFQNDFWGMKLSHKKSHKSYRPITILSFRLHYWLKGYLDPTDFHTINIFLHTIVCIITLFVFEILLDWKEPQVSFYATMLFAVHPIHAEAVSGIVGRADILCGLFMWLSILSYYKCVRSKSYFVQYNCILLCITNSAIAMFCKETGVTILGICIVYDLIIVNKILPVNLLSVVRLKYSYEDIKKLLTYKLPLIMRCTILLFASSLLVLLRFKIMGFSKPIFRSVDNPVSFLDNIILRIINYNYIYFLNLWLLLCPNWLCFDWSMGCIPLIYGVDLRISFVIFLWFFFIGFIVIILSKKNQHIIRNTTIGVAVLIIPFLPASNLFFTVGFVLAERTLYIPSAGYCLLVVIGFKKLCTNMMYSKIMSVCFCSLLILLFARSWFRSEEWKTEKTLFQSGLRVCPLNAKVHYNVGKNAADRGIIDHAKFEYQEAIRLYPDYAQAMNNLGNLYKDENAYDKAETLLRKAVNLQNDFAAAWMNLGIVLSAINKYEEAEKCYNIAISHRETYPDSYYNLGLLYLANQKFEKALKVWKIAVEQKRTHGHAWTNMILLLDNIGKKEEALQVAKQALHYNPNHSSIHFNMGNILGKNKNFNASEYHFKMAISNDQKNPVYYINLGVLYHQWNKYDKAKLMYNIALKLNPQSHIAKENLNILNNKKHKKINQS